MEPSSRLETGIAEKILLPNDVEAWLVTPNRALKGYTPAERVVHGDSKSVLALIEAMADGVVT